MKKFKCELVICLAFIALITYGVSEDIRSDVSSRQECRKILDELVVGPSAKSECFIEQLSYARRLYELGDFPRASALLNELHDTADDYGILTTEALFLSASIAYLIGDYNQAETQYSTILDAPDNSFTVKSKIGLLNTYFQTNQFHKAQNLYSGITEKSSQQDDQLVRSFNAMCNMMRSFSENEPYRVQWHDNNNRAAISFIAATPVPVVEVEINGRIINCILDTGCGITVVDAEIARSLNIDEIDTDKGVYAGGKTREFSYGKVNSLTLSGVTLHSIPVEMMPVNWVVVDDNTSKEIVVNGVIGIDTLRHFLATIDFPGQQLTLEPRRHRLRPNGSRTENHAYTGVAEIPFALVSTHLILAKGGIGSKNDLTVFLDSGLSHPDAAVLLPKQTMEYVGIPIPQTSTEVTDNDMVLVGGFSIGSFPVDSLRVGKLEQTDLVGLYGVFPPELYFGGLSNSTSPFFIDALISHNFLKPYKWTIDFDSRTMLFYQ